MTAQIVVFKLTTAAGTNSSRVADAYTGYGCSWRNSVDGCDAAGTGRVFIECPADTADFLAEQFDVDESIVEYDRA